MTGISLDEFKNRLPLAEIVGRFVKLTRHGRELKGLCPFHNEKTPSFGVVEDKNFYHCFGCGAHGNAIDFIMAHERLEFPEALNRLSELTGIPAPVLKPERPKDPVVKGIEDANQAAMQWFQDQLASNAGGEARRYLKGRGLAQDEIKDFKLGYAPTGRTGLIDALAAGGFSSALLLEAGLISKLDDGGLLDRFRHRLMFPIIDPRGRCLGFGGRALGDAKAKYLNTAETPLFHKGDQLYGLNHAGREARRQNRIIVAEGYMDVIAFHRAGIGLAVAPLGTAVTENQLALLWRHADEPILCLDGDEAGKRAAIRAAKRALPLLKPGKSLQFAMLPEGQDPDNLLEARGASALKEVIDQPQAMIELLYRSELAANPADTPERRAQLKRQLGMLAANIEDNDVRIQYQTMFRERIDALWQPQRRFGSRRRAGPQRPSQLTRSDLSLTAVSRGIECALLYPILQNPVILDEVEEEFDGIELADPELRALKSEILNYFTAKDPETGVDAGGLRDHLTEYGYEQLIAEIADRRIGRGSIPIDVARGQEIEQWRSNVARWRIGARRREEGSSWLEDLLSDDPASALARAASVKRLLDDEGGSDGG